MQTVTAGKRHTHNFKVSSSAWAQDALEAGSDLLVAGGAIVIAAGGLDLVRYY